MTEPSIDSWLPSGTLVGTPDQVYAYGVIALTYNKIEDAMTDLLAAYLPISGESASRFAARLTNSERIGLLQDLVQELEDDIDVSDKINQAIKAFSICTENRNILAHGVRDISVSHDKYFIIRKWSSGGKRVAHYDIPLDQLRQIAHELRDCLSFLISILLFLIVHRGADRNDLDDASWKNHRASLPGKLLQPSKLIPRPPGLDHEAALLRLQPSDPS